MTTGREGEEQKILGAGTGPLVDPRVTAEVLRRHGFSMNKRFGQNFLIDAHVLQKIIDAAELNKEDTVVEIGPGIGTMTQAMSEAAGKVIAIEIDDKLIPVLSDTLSDRGNVEIIHDDVMKVDLRALAEEKNGGKEIKVVANLPYYITTPIIMRLLEEALPIESITVMVQKEVAVRMQAAPGTKECGALSLAVQYYAEAYLAANVPLNCFMPRPNVDSAVIRLKLRKEAPVKTESPELMFRLIRASFNQRRKTLVNGLRNSGIFALSREELVALLEKAGLSENTRGETLGLPEFARLSDVLLPYALPGKESEEGSEA